jgi:cell wall-associated NlpC family hydrolase
MNTDKYVGIPFRDHGRDWDGCDCYGLIRLVYWHEFGIPLPSLDDEYATALERKEAAGLLGEGGPTWAGHVETPGTGDVVRLRRQGEPRGGGTHLGLIVDPIQCRMLHVHNHASSVIERYDGLAWRHRVDGYLKWVG